MKIIHVHDPAFVEILWKTLAETNNPYQYNNVIESTNYWYKSVHSPQIYIFEHNYYLINHSETCQLLFHTTKENHGVTKSVKHKLTGF